MKVDDAAMPLHFFIAELIVIEVEGYCPPITLEQVELPVILLNLPSMHAVQAPGLPVSPLAQRPSDIGPQVVTPDGQVVHEPFALVSL